MGVRILEDEEGLACLYCSTSDWAFGPIFHDGRNEAQKFLDWLGDGKDPRLMSDSELRGHYSDWLIEQESVDDTEDA